MEQTEKKEAWDQALVSIITPVYNVEPYVARCIESVLAQTRPNWELLLIDDGSTDGSGAICDAYAAQDARIRVFHQENRGVSEARNVGLDNARGDYVLFADSDDWLAPEMLTGMMAAGQGAELVVCGQTNVFVRKNGREKRVERRIWQDAGETADIYYKVLARTGMMCNKLFRRDVVDTLRFDEGLSYGEDTIFLTRALLRVHAAVLVPEPWYFYRKNRLGNVVSSPPDPRTLQYLDNMVRVYRMVRDRGEGPCGVRRIAVAVKETLDKIPYDGRKQYREYIVQCGRALRQVSTADRLRYLCDKRFLKTGSKRLGFLMKTWCPVLFFEFNHSTARLARVFKRKKAKAHSKQKELQQN